MKEQVTVITEPLLSTQFVQYREIGPVLEGLSPHFDLAVAAPALDSKVQFDLQRIGIEPISGRASFPKLRDGMDEVPSWALSWIRDALTRGNGKRVEKALSGRPGLRINRSMTVAVKCDSWCIQSHPLGIALDKMGPSIDWPYRVTIRAATPIVGLVEWAHIRKAAELSDRVYVANTYLADLYGSLGIPVRGTLPPYLREGFRPSTNNPTRDFALVYMGRELDTEGFRALADTGMPIKMFGSKSADWVRRAVGRSAYPNVQNLGKVSFEELRDLYSNALFTAFIFTEESFGLVPVESMACGTPVLTYSKQGPRDTVLPGRTGWHVQSSTQLADAARGIWRDGYPEAVREVCVSRAAEYSLSHVTEMWRDLITAGLSGQEEPPSIRLRQPTIDILGRGPHRLGPWPSGEIFVSNLASPADRSLDEIGLLTLDPATSRGPVSPGGRPALWATKGPRRPGGPSGGDVESALSPPRRSGTK